MVQEGVIGLMDAIQRFDPTHPTQCEFTSYAHTRIRGQIIDAIRAFTPLSRGHLDQIEAGTMPQTSECSTEHLVHLPQEGLLGDPEEVAHQRQRREMIQSSIRRRLPSRTAQAMWRFYYTDEETPRNDGAYRHYGYRMLRAGLRHWVTHEDP